MRYQTETIEHYIKLDTGTMAQAAHKKGLRKMNQLL